MSEAVEAPQEPATPVAIETPVTPAIPAEGAKGVQNDGKQATPEDTEGKKPEGDEQVTPEQAAKREGRRFGRKLDAAYRRAAEEKARADFLDEQLRLARQQTQPKLPEGTPKLESFQSVEEYETAVAKFHRENAIKEYQEQLQQMTAKQAEQRLLTDWEKKAERGSSKYDDFDTVVGELKPVNAVAAAIMQADNGDEIAYYLMKNPAEMRKFGQLDQLAQVRFIGQLEAKLSAEPEKPKMPSKAPAPITPLGGKSGSTSDMPQDTDDIATWMKKENARMKKLAQMHS